MLTKGQTMNPLIRRNRKGVTTWTLKGSSIVITAEGHRYTAAGQSFQTLAQAYLAVTA